jgi:hypothetical protein
MRRLLNQAGKGVPPLSNPAQRRSALGTLTKVAPKLAPLDSPLMWAACCRPVQRAVCPLENPDQRTASFGIRQTKAVPSLAPLPNLVPVGLAPAPRPLWTGHIPGVLPSANRMPPFAFVGASGG